MAYRGQGLAEYALILALIAVICIVAIAFLGSEISGIFTRIGELFSNAPGASPSP